MASVSTWSGIRNKLENDYLCPALRGHIQYFATSYSKSADHEGRAAIRMELMPMAQAPALGEVVSNTSAKERQHKCEVLISEAMGIASVQNPFTDRNMPYE